MTPLAHFVAKQLTLPVKDREKNEDHTRPLYKQMAGVHCFELSSVHSMVIELADKIAFNSHDVGVLGFLPAPKTWIEWADEYRREAYFLEEIDGGAKCDVTFAAEYDREYERLYKEASGLGIERSLIHSWVVNNYSRGERGYWVNHQGLETQDDWNNTIANTHKYMSLYNDKAHTTASSAVIVKDSEGTELYNNAALIYAALAVINSPRIIGRLQHMPNRGLERRLTRSLGAGKFPLHAWTEITLHVTPPKDMMDDPSIEAHYTGQRALHFCRAHLRVRLGRLEIVRSHWRGDPALGIKQSRYVLKDSQSCKAQ